MTDEEVPIHRGVCEKHGPYANVVPQCPCQDFVNKDRTPPREHGPTHRETALMLAEQALDKAGSQTLATIALVHALVAVEEHLARAERDSAMDLLARLVDWADDGMASDPSGDFKALDEAHELLRRHGRDVR